MFILLRLKNDTLIGSSIHSLFPDLLSTHTASLLTHHVTVANSGLLLEVHKRETKMCTCNVIIAQKPPLFKQHV